MDRSEITQILASAGLRPQHQFGQNFMIDQNILRAIADAGDIHPEDVILEVGPGVGNLTRLLAQRSAHVLAVDIDYKLMPAAQRHHTSIPNISWLNTDVLAGKHQIEPTVIAKLRELCTAHPTGQLKLVSNLPYNAASPLIAELLVEMWKETQSTTGTAPLLFSRLAFTVQYEVAQAAWPPANPPPATTAPWASSSNSCPPSRSSAKSPPARSGPRPKSTPPSSPSRPTPPKSPRSPTPSPSNPSPPGHLSPTAAKP